MSSDWVLVTGANGFLGARLVRELVSRGEKVKAMVRAGSNLGQLQDLPQDQLKIAVADARMCDRVYAAMTGCDRVYHVAASYSIDERHRDEIMADALEGTRATLEAARRAGLKKIVMTSSVATMGPTRDPEPLDESASFELKKPNAYAAAKFAAEELALKRADQGAPIVLVNPSVIVGPGDWKPTPTGGQILYYLGYSPSMRMPVPPGGFSYADVDDVVDGHIAAMEKGRWGERYLLGGDNLSNREFFQLLADVTGLAEPGKEVSRGMLEWLARFQELKSAWTDTAPMLTLKSLDDYYGRFIFVNSDKAKKELGYDPRPAREGLARSCRWFLDNGYVSKKAARRARLELQPA